MRRRSLLLMLVALSTGACHGQPGASFVGATLLAPPSDAEAAHDGLIRADLGRGDSVSRLGVRAGLLSSLAGNVVYLRGGMPIVRGEHTVGVIIAAESIGTRTAVRWQPVRAEVSRDGLSGYTYGYAISGVSEAGAPVLRVDRYIAFWRRDGGGAWKIEAYAETYGGPPPTLAMPREVVDSALADVPMSRAGGALEAMRAADVEFSVEASRSGVGDAFGRYAAGDAQIFSALGEFITGPEAISGSFGAPTRNGSLVWHPVYGDVAGSGDLGFTVGNAVFRGERDGGAAVVRYSKYLTVWKRQTDGSWKYVVDGGSVRPGH